MNVIKHIMLGQGPSIQKLPFLSNTTFLIESFLIVGYSPETIKQLTINTSQTITTPPDIISYITNSNKTNQHFDSICKYVFPTQPEAYNHAHLKQKLQMKSKFIFFFQEFNCNSTEQQRNNKSGCYTGFVYKFYETYVDYNNNTVYVPKAFCVLSRNCCFGFCNKLCELVYDKYKNGIEVIPIEVLIYNIVHFIPVPLKTHMNVDFELLLTTRNETSFRSTISTTYSDNISRRFSMESSFKYMVEQLSGYPKFHFSMYDILRVVPYKNLVEIVLYMLFEFNVFFFSQHVDILNNVMYICSMLLYPLTDTHLMSDIVTVSDNEFNNVCARCEKNKSFIMGINVSFAKWKNVMNVMNFDKFVLVDVDSKQLLTCVQIRSKVKTVSDVDVKVDDETKQIVEIISRLSNKKKVGCTQLEYAIHRLINSLNDFTKRNSIKETTLLPVSLPEELFTYDITKNICTLNLELQGMFYVGVISFIKFFYQLHSTTINENFGDFSDESNDPVIVNEVDNVKLSKEEKALISVFNKTMLYDRYIKFFLKKRQLIDNYHFQFIFADELIQTKYYVDHNTQSPKDYTFGKELLMLIDKVYGANNYKQVYDIDFTEFISFCQKDQLKELFVYSLHESSVYTKKPKGGECVFKVKHIELDDNILFKYSYALYNVDALSKLFPFIEMLHNNDIHSISSIDIANTIETHLTLSQDVKVKDIILSTYYNLLACIAEKVDLQCQFTAITSTFPLYGFSCRKSFNILLTIYNNIIQRKFQSKQPIQDEIDHLNKLLQYFVSNGNLPNEVFILLMKRLLLLKKMRSFDVEDKNNVNKRERAVTDISKDVQFDLFCDDPNIKKREIKNYILKQIEHTINETNLSIPGKSNKSLDVKSIWLSVSLAKNEHKILSSIYSPVKLYKKVNAFTMKYINTGKRDVFAKEKFLRLVSMLMFYIHYIEELKKISYEPFVKYLKLG